MVRPDDHGGQDVAGRHRRQYPARGNGGAGQQDQDQHVAERADQGGRRLCPPDDDLCPRPPRSVAVGPSRIFERDVELGFSAVGLRSYRGGEIVGQGRGRQWRHKPARSGRTAAQRLGRILRIPRRTGRQYRQSGVRQGCQPAAQCAGNPDGLHRHRRQHHQGRQPRKPGQRCIAVRRLCDHHLFRQQPARCDRSRPCYDPVMGAVGGYGADGCIRGAEERNRVERRHFAGRPQIDLYLSGCSRREKWPQSRRL